MFDLVNFGGNGFRAIPRGAGRNTGPVANPGSITEIACIVEGGQEFPFDIDEVRRGEKEGHYKYFAYRTTGNIVEYKYTFTG